MKSKALSICFMGILIIGAGRCWSQASQPAEAQSTGDLPGEEPLPSVDTQLHVPMGPPAGTPSGKKVTQTRALPFDLALDAAHTALESCLADGYPMAVAVSDEHGYILVGLSADGAPTKGVYDA